MDESAVMDIICDKMFEFITRIHKIFAETRKIQRIESAEI
jgi:hypothetical protein